MMSDQMIKSDLLVDLSREEQQFLSGGDFWLEDYDGYYYCEGPYYY